MVWAALVSKSGSLGAMWPSSRCGFRPCLAQMRATAMCVGPSARFNRQLARGPVRRVVGRLALVDVVQHARLQLHGDLVAAASGVASEQTGSPFGFEALAQAVDAAVAGIQLGADLGSCASLGAAVHRTRLPLQVHALLPSQ